MRILFLIGVLAIMGICGFFAYLKMMGASPAKRLIATKTHQGGFSFQVEYNSLKPGRYAICLDASSSRVDEMNTRISSDLEIVVKVYNSEMKLLKEDHLENFLAYFPKGRFYVISEFINTGLPLRGGTINVTLSSKAEPLSDFGLFLSPSPIP